MAIEPITWQRFEWKSGADHYKFEVLEGGLFGALTAAGAEGFAARCRSITLPMVAWEGLLDSVRTNRKSRDKAAGQVPARAGQNWSATETSELQEGFQAGRSISDLAHSHSRSQAAIQAQLAKLGLWNLDI
jgi:hypothetical protein